MIAKKKSIPLVSIWSITFNHENFIEKCLDGIVNQKTNFDFEVVIGDDCSTDGTIEIIKKYHERYPYIINPIFQKQNVGIYSNAYLSVYPKLNGKYIAICEGDDYWTDPYKLQKQVDFLENNPDYSICFHNVEVFDENQQQFVEDNLTRAVSSSTTLKDLSIGNYIHTPSVLFRNIVNPLPDWFSKTPVGDYPLWCLAALKGNIYKMDEKMAVYRVHNNGLMNSYKNKSIDQKIAFNEGMIPFYRYMYSVSEIKHFRKKLIIIINANLSYALTANNIVLAKKYAKILIKNHLLHLSFNQFFSALFTFLFPNQLKKRYAKQG